MMGRRKLSSTVNWVCAPRMLWKKDHIAGVQCKVNFYGKQAALHDTAQQFFFFLERAPSGSSLS